MTVEATNLASDLTADAHAEPPRPVRGLALKLAHLGWWFIYCALIVLIVVALPLNLSYYHQLCQATQCNNQQLTRQQLDNLLALGLSLDFYASYLVALSLILTGAFLLVAPIIVLRRSQERVALFVSFTLTLFGGVTAPSFFDILSQTNPIWWFPTQFLGYIGSVAIIAFFYLFPSGEFVPRWTRLAIVVWMIEEIPGFFLRGTALHLPDFINYLFFAVFVLSGIVAQWYRYRRVSNATERRQTKWVVFGVTIALGGLLSLSLLDPLFAASAQDMALFLIWNTLFTGFLTLIPIAIGIAILRSHLWDIDLLINRTLVYVPLTAILAGIFAASISFSQKLFIVLTGQQSEAATVLTTLIVVAAFTPLKDGMQSIVTKHFKEVHDPVKRLDAFGERVRTRLFVLDRDQTLRRLLEETVAAFDASGGAVYIEHDGNLKLIHSVGKKAGGEALGATIGTAATKYGQVSLGPRRNGTAYSVRDREAIEQLTDVLAHAMAQGDTSRS